VSEQVTIELSAECSALFAALAEFQAECEAPKKLSTNPHFKSKFADLAEVLETARGPLAKHGLALLQFPCGGSQGSVGVATMLTHKSGQWVRAAVVFPIEKSSPQAAGSAITYARRYSAMAALGMAPEDDDGESAEGRGSSRTRKGKTDGAERERPAASKAAASEPPRTAKWWRDQHNELIDRAFKAGIVSGPADDHGLHKPTLMMPRFSAKAQQHAGMDYDKVPGGYLRSVIWRAPDFGEQPAPVRLWVSYLVAKHEIAKLEAESAERALSANDFRSSQP
jgi:hypothetical protein